MLSRVHQRYFAAVHYEIGAKSGPLRWASFTSPTQPNIFNRNPPFDKCVELHHRPLNNAYSQIHVPIRPETGAVSYRSANLKEPRFGPLDYPHVRVSDISLTDVLSSPIGAADKGDLVLVVRRGAPTLGVVLSTAPYTSILATGFHMIHGPHEVWFRVKGAYIDPLTRTLVKSESEIQVDLRELMQAATAMHNETRVRFADAYRTFVVEKQTPFVPLIQYIEWVFHVSNKQPLTVTHGLTAILHIVSNPTHYLGSNSSLVQKKTVEFRSTRASAVLEAGRALISAEAKNLQTAETSALSSFIQKCTRILKHNIPGSGHNVRAHQDLEWTREDMILFDCIREVAFGRRESVTPFSFVGTQILAPLGYSSNISRSEHAIQLLVDLGVYHRLDNFELYKTAYELRVNGLGFADADLKYANAGHQALSISKTPRVVDRLNSFRCEFGRDHAIYTIDDVYAREIDDGISIELGPDSQVDWVHVHIADPSAYLSQDSLVAQLALERGQTIYFPEASYPMIVGDLATDLLSLSTLPELDRPVYAITVSFQMLSNGDITNARVRPVIAHAHTIKSRIYDLVDTVLDHKVPGLIPDVGPDPIALSSIPQNDMSLNEYRRLAYRHQEPICSSEIRDLKALQAVAVSHAKYRREVGGCFLFTDTNCQVRLLKSAGTGEFPRTELLNQTPRLLGSKKTPEYEIQITRDLLSRSPARMMVSELMIMAGRACAMYAKQHGIPMPYRHQPPPSNYSQDDPITDRINPVTQALSFRDSLWVMAMSSPAHQSTTPGAHFQMGISGNPGYIKITSPLRRATDLLGHYQLKAHFSGGGVMPHHHLYGHMSALHVRERVIKSMQQKREVWWAMEALKLRFRRDKLQTYTARVVKSSTRAPMSGLFPSVGGCYASVILLDAGVHAFAFVPNVKVTDLEVGEFLQVVLLSVDPLACTVSCLVTVRMVELSPDL